MGPTVDLVVSLILAAVSWLACDLPENKIGSDHLAHNRVVPNVSIEHLAVELLNILEIHKKPFSLTDSLQLCLNHKFLYISLAKNETHHSSIPIQKSPDELGVVEV